MRVALARHDVLARAAIEGHNGTIVKMTGDGVYAAFRDPVDGVSAALQLQQALADPQATNGVALPVRSGLHFGIVECRDSDYLGSAVNRTARIMRAGHGGQVIVSQAVALLVTERLPAGVALRDLGSVRLRDLANPERIYQVVHPQLRRDFPALRSLEATPNNLPQQITSFVGRERALAEVRQLLRNTRLLTLVGVGGLGKTRLSLQVGAEPAKDLLQAGAQVKVLASSRESLHVVGETTYPLSTLAIPDQRKNLTIAALTQYEAVHLFRDRAIAAQPEFRITDRNAMAVADEVEHVSVLMH